MQNIFESAHHDGGNPGLLANPFEPEGKKQEPLPMVPVSLSSGAATVPAEKGAAVRVQIASPGLFFPKSWRIEGCDPRLLRLREVRITNRIVYPPQLLKPLFCTKAQGLYIEAQRTQHEKGILCDIAQECGSFDGWVLPPDSCAVFLFENESEQELAFTLTLKGQEIDASEIKKKATATHPHDPEGCVDCKMIGLP